MLYFNVKHLESLNAALIHSLKAILVSACIPRLDTATSRKASNFKFIKLKMIDFVIVMCDNLARVSSATLRFTTHYKTCI